MVPDVNNSIDSGCKCNTFLIESDACKVGELASRTENTFLEKSLTCISWVPELNFFETNSTESKIVRFLWPGNMDNLIFTPFNIKQVFILFDIVDYNVMIIVQINSNDVPLARW